jgi:Protein of unknown function (DUF1826)
MRQYYQLATTLFLLLPQNSWSFSPRPHLSAASVETTTQQQQHDEKGRAMVVATDNKTNINVLTFSFPHHKTSSTAWKSLIPLIPRERGCDVSIEWSLPQEGSRRLLQHLFPSSSIVVNQLHPFLEESFSTFSSLTGGGKKFKARIVATRGSRGQKCPRWHVDHVPLRWIQSFVGPGCDYVLGSAGINWDAINDLDDLEENDANSKLVDTDIACIVHAPPLQGVVLWGSENNNGLSPAVHKSPSLGVLEGRVLLTLDVLPDE